MTEAAGVEEARRAAARAEPPFELLIVDVSLPDGDGCLLAKDLAAGRGRPRVVVMSGFSPSLLREEGTESAGHLFLQKPFRPAELREAIGKAFG